MAVTQSSTRTIKMTGATGTHALNIPGSEASTWTEILGWPVEMLVKGPPPKGKIVSYFDYGHSFLVEISWNTGEPNEMVVVDSSIDEYASGYTFFASNHRFIVYPPPPLIFNSSRNL